MSVDPATQQLLRRAYDAFNARDIEAALVLMHPDVDWPNALAGTRVHGRAEVRDYWARQFEVIDSRVEPLAFSARANGSIAVQVHQTVRDRTGALLSDGTVEHVYSIRDDQVERMDISDDGSRHAPGQPGRMTE